MKMLEHDHLWWNRLRFQIGANMIHDAGTAGLASPPCELRRGADPPQGIDGLEEALDAHGDRINGPHVHLDIEIALELEQARCH
jgi:hypothetical protein